MAQWPPDFWSVKEPRERQNQQIHFMKNMAMLGGALLMARTGAGPLSLDEWLAGRRRRPGIAADIDHELMRADPL